MGVLDTLPLSLAQIDLIADYLSKHDGVSLVDAICSSTEIPRWIASDLADNREVAVALMKRAKRYRIARQKITASEIQELSLTYLTSVIDDDSETTRNRLKAIEIIAKIAALGQGAAPVETQAIDLDAYVEKIRRDLLGIGADE